MAELLFGFPFADLIVTGLSLCGLSAALLIQCGDKRAAKKKKAIKSKVSVKDKGRSKKSLRSSKSKKGSIENSKKSNRSSKQSKSNSIGIASKPIQEKTRSSKRSDKESALVRSLKTAKEAPQKTAQQVAEKPKHDDKKSRSSKRATKEHVLVGSTKTAREAPQKAAQQTIEQDDPSLKSLTITQEESQTETRTALEVVSNDGPAELHIEPRALRFGSDGGLLEVRLHNPTAFRLAFKVKCSDNAIYRINPVYGFVEPHQQLKVLVVRKDGSRSKTDKLVFVIAKASGESNDFKELFKAGVKSSNPLMVLPLIA